MASLPLSNRFYRTVGQWPTDHYRAPIVELAQMRWNFLADGRVPRVIRCGLKEIP
jgi:hypothetical protein